MKQEIIQVFKFVLVLMISTVSFVCVVNASEIDCQKVTKECTGCTIDNIMNDSSCDHCLSLIIDGSVDECKAIYQNNKKTMRERVPA